MCSKEWSRFISGILIKIYFCYRVYYRKNKEGEAVWIENEKYSFFSYIKKRKRFIRETWRMTNEPVKWIWYEFYNSTHESVIGVDYTNAVLTCVN